MTYHTVLRLLVHVYQYHVPLVELITTVVEQRVEPAMSRVSSLDIRKKILLTWLERKRRANFIVNSQFSHTFRDLLYVYCSTRISISLLRKNLTSITFNHLSDRSLFLLPSMEWQTQRQPRLSAKGASPCSNTGRSHDYSCWEIVIIRWSSLKSKQPLQESSHLSSVVLKILRIEIPADFKWCSWIAAVLMDL